MTSLAVIFLPRAVSREGLWRNRTELQGAGRNFVEAEDRAVFADELCADGQRGLPARRRTSPARSGREMTSTSAASG